MYTIIKAKTYLYPWVILLLRSHLGEEGYWCLSDVHAEECILDAYNATKYEGIVMDGTPTHGSWIEPQDIHKGTIKSPPKTAQR